MQKNCSQREKTGKKIEIRRFSAWFTAKARHTVSPYLSHGFGRFPVAYDAQCNRGKRHTGTARQKTDPQRVPLLEFAAQRAVAVAEVDVFGQFGPVNRRFCRARKCSANGHFHCRTAQQRKYRPRKAFRQSFCMRQNRPAGMPQ